MIIIWNVQTVSTTVLGIGQPIIIYKMILIKVGLEFQTTIIQRMNLNSIKLCVAPESYRFQSPQ